MTVDGCFSWGRQGPGNASLNRWQLNRGQMNLEKTTYVWRWPSSDTGSPNAGRQEWRLTVGHRVTAQRTGEAGRGRFMAGLPARQEREVQVWPQIDRKTSWALFEMSRFGFCMKHYLWNGQKYTNANASGKHYSCTTVFHHGGLLSPLWLSNYMTWYVIENPRDMVFHMWTTVLLWLRLFGPGECCSELSMSPMASSKDLLPLS